MAGHNLSAYPGICLIGKFWAAISSDPCMFIEYYSCFITQRFPLPFLFERTSRPGNLIKRWKIGAETRPSDKSFPVISRESEYQPLTTAFVSQHLYACVHPSSAPKQIHPPPAPSPPLHSPPFINGIKIKVVHAATEEHPGESSSLQCQALCIPPKSPARCKGVWAGECAATLPSSTHSSGPATTLCTTEGLISLKKILVTFPPPW